MARYQQMVDNGEMPVEEANAEYKKEIQEQINIITKSSRDKLFSF